MVFWVVTKCPVEGQYPDIGRSSSQRKMITKIREDFCFDFMMRREDMKTVVTTIEVLRKLIILVAKFNIGRQ